MLANKDSTARTMLRALAHTSNALDAAIELDVDRTLEDRSFFRAEKAGIDTLFEALEAASRAVDLHELREEHKAQAHIEVGDVVLDRGTRRAKKRMTLETNLAAADQVFGEDISEIVDAERHVEPNLVLKCLERLGSAGDFGAKAEIEGDLRGRATRQGENFNRRASTELAATGLEATLARAIEAGADGLYKLEKRLLERFARERVYVQAFFWDVKRKRGKREEE